MALPATDTFTTDTDQTLPNYSSNWTQNNGTCNVLSVTDDWESGALVDWLAHWNADTFDDDQYAEGEFSAVTDERETYTGVSVRVATSAVTGYTQEGSGDRAGEACKYLGKLVAGSWTTLGSNNDTGYDVNDVLRLEAHGTTLTPLLNGTEDTDLGAQTDSAITSGSAGLCAWGAETSIRMDNWEGGNLLPAQDDFTGTNGTQLTTYNSRWTLNSGDFDIQGNELCADAPTSGNIHGAHWNAATFDNDQYAQAIARVTADNTDINIGVSVRCHASSDDFYDFHWRSGDGDDLWLYKTVAGAYTQLSWVEADWSDGDLFRLEVSGTTLTCLKNGSTTGAPGAQTDSARSSGFPGVSGWNDGTDMSCDIRYSHC
jgi:hypothetical protein